MSIIALLSFCASWRVLFGDDIATKLLRHLPARPLLATVATADRGVRHVSLSVMAFVKPVKA
jgi:hypothetical protein